MNSTRRFAAAHWPRSLQMSSALGTALLVGIGIAAYRAIPIPNGFTHGFGTVVALVLPASLILSLLFTVTGYIVSPTDLAVQRLFWSTHVPLVGLGAVYADPTVCRHSLRIIGNAGLFGFTGLYQSSKLGRYRLFATDISHSVVLVLPGRTVVVTPSATESFIAHIRQIFPAAQQAPETGNSSRPAHPLRRDHAQGTRY